jgi:hypothetical protein
MEFDPTGRAKKRGLSTKGHEGARRRKSEIRSPKSAFGSEAQARREATPKPEIPSPKGNGVGFGFEAFD